MSNRELYFSALIRNLRLIVVPPLAAAALMLAGCAQQATQPSQAGHAQPTAAPDPVAQESNPEANAQLSKLWQDRLNEQQDFPIGTGDVLEISIPNVKELEDRTVRVDGKGNVMLPLVGSLHVAGLTEPQVSDELADALHKYVYHPEINLLVKTYSSRVVGVMGSVRSPGLYVLNGPDDTVHDLIERAGGLAENAAHVVLLSPAQPGSHTASALAHQLAEGSAQKPQSSAAGTGMVENADPRNVGGVTKTALEVDRGPWVNPPSNTDFDAGAAYVIELNGDPQAQKYVNLPLRPGDTLFVPPAGQISVVGWVYHPSVIPVRPGLTALGAVSAAGGFMYASDSSAVKIMRHQAGDQTKVMYVDLAAVQKGQAQDVALEANDIVDVSYSTVKIPGYAFYYAAQAIVSFAPAAILMGGI
jgi:protein involved in polysaccharide export with SLBB domain